MFGTLVNLMDASGPMWNLGTMRAKLVDFGLDLGPTDTRFFPVSVDYPTTVSRASPKHVRMEYMNLEFPQLWLLVQVKVCVTLLVPTIRRRRLHPPEARHRVPIRWRLSLLREKRNRPILIAHGWDGHHKLRRLLGHKLMMDPLGHSGTWAEH